MKIREKLQMDREGLLKEGPINIVILGDSVSHGAVNGYMDYEGVYWNLLKKRLHAYRDYVPVNMICSSVGGTTAMQAVERLDRQVLSHAPDLVIVCFGLNDVTRPLENYLSALATIFERCKAAGCEVIFMTPNMLNTYVAGDTPEKYLGFAARTAELQNNGTMDRYMASACELARGMGVSVCDCYAKWRALYDEGRDTTLLLANRINHPIPEMHVLFADALYEQLLGDAQGAAENEDGMLHG